MAKNTFDIYKSLIFDGQTKSYDLSIMSIYRFNNGNNFNEIAIELKFVYRK